MCSQNKPALLNLEPSNPQEQDQSDPARDNQLTERGQIIQRVVKTLQDNHLPNPSENEQLLYECLQRTISAPNTPGRPSVIRCTPNCSPFNPLSPLEPVSTPPRRSSSELGSVFASPSSTQRPLNCLSGESLNLNLVASLAVEFKGIGEDSTTPSEEQSGEADSVPEAFDDNLTDPDPASNPTGECINLSSELVPVNSVDMSTILEVSKELEDLEDEKSFIFRTLPADSLDEISLIPDYEESLKNLTSIAMAMNKALKNLTAFGNQIEPDVLESWKTKVTGLETALNLYRREVRRRCLQLRTESVNPPPTSIC